MGRGGADRGCLPVKYQRSTTPALEAVSPPSAPPPAPPVPVVPAGQGPTPTRTQGSQCGRVQCYWQSGTVTARGQHECAAATASEKPGPARVPRVPRPPAGAALPGTKIRELGIWNKESWLGLWHCAMIRVSLIQHHDSALAREGAVTFSRRLSGGKWCARAAPAAAALQVAPENGGGPGP
jgi:hypothetical protein